MHSLGTPAVKLQNIAVNNITIASARCHAYAPLDSAKRTTSAQHYSFEYYSLIFVLTASIHHRNSHHTQYNTALPS